MDKGLGEMRMKMLTKRVRTILAMLLCVIICFQAAPIKTNAAFNDLKRVGCKFNLKKGNWVLLQSKLPGSSKYHNFYAKVIKFSKSQYPASSTTTTSSSSTSTSTTTVNVTVQVQIPKTLSKKVAKKLINTGHDYIDFLDVVVVDKYTGENLNTSETSEDGTNYKGVSVTETEWKGFKPQRLAWDSGVVYDYYVSYVKTLTIKYPSSYDRTCLGVCGTHINNYDNMVDWNEGFTEGYTVFSDTTHVKLGNKGVTGKLSHFLVIK